MDNNVDHCNVLLWLSLEGGGGSVLSLIWFPGVHLVTKATCKTMRREGGTERKVSLSLLPASFSKGLTAEFINKCKFNREWQQDDVFLNAWLLPCEDWWQSRLRCRNTQTERLTPHLLTHELYNVHLNKILKYTYINITNCLNLI